MLRVLNIRTAVPMQKPLAALVAKKLRCSRSDISGLTIVRRSIDARRKPRIYFVFTVDVSFADEDRVWKRCRDNKDVRRLNETPAPEIHPGTQPMAHRPIVIGTGPSGLAAALALAEHGYAPIVFERGCDVDTRTKDVETFWRGGPFKASSNVQFGEGGAGTFSDGKLTTRVNHPLLRRILQTFVDAGAPEDILYAYNPHVGTDVLRRVVKNMRHTIEVRGGEVHFSSCVTAIHRDDEGRITSVTVNDRDEYPAELVVMGIGHSARDTYYMLHDQGVTLEKKPFAVGVRIEHSQDVIDRAQYGCPAADLGLEPADYALVYHSPEGRSCYSFCMCPGGVIVPSSCSENTLCVNGMSYSARDGEYANSAILVQIPSSDFDHGHPLDGFLYQKQLEQLAFRKDYSAPAMNIADYVHHHDPVSLVHGSSYPRTLVTEDMHQLFHEPVNRAMEEGFLAFDQKIPGFIDQEIMIGMESRSSSPIRILRNPDGQSSTVNGLYPCGEGAGYAGGIVSSAVDGITQAENVISFLKKTDR